MHQTESSPDCYTAESLNGRTTLSTVILPVVEQRHIFSAYNTVQKDQSFPERERAQGTQNSQKLNLFTLEKTSNSLIDPINSEIEKGAEEAGGASCCNYPKSWMAQNKNWQLQKRSKETFVIHCIINISWSGDGYFFFISHVALDPYVKYCWYCCSTSWRSNR